MPTQTKYCDTCKALLTAVIGDPHKRWCRRMKILTRASLTNDQRRLLEAIIEQLIDADDGRARDAAWMCSRLDWEPERVETVAAELRELGMIEDRLMSQKKVDDQPRSRPTTDDDYLVDATRLDGPETGIYIRARHGEKWGSHDLAHLDRDSVTRWLRRGEGTAERTVLLLLFGASE